MFRLVIFSCLFLATFADLYTQTTPTEERIVGGRDTDISEVPYQVSVQYEFRHLCGGSIIGAKRILTAAHCVEGKDPALFSVRAGSSYHFKGGQDVDVEDVIIHPNYNTTTIDYDVAILVLKNCLTSEKGVGIATLANVEPQAGEMVQISGWGAKEKGNMDAHFLQSASVPVVPKNLCKEKYEPKNKITDRMFCAGYMSGGKDSCDGDSGGPAVVNGKLAGIVSWGEGCAKKDYPGVYTSIPSILTWIASETLE